MGYIRHGSKPHSHPRPEALQGVCSNPLDLLYFMSAFSGQLYLSTGHLRHWMTRSSSTRDRGFAAQLVKAEC